MRSVHAIVILVLAGSLATPALSATAADVTLARLSGLSGQAFDVAVMQALVPIHEEAVEMAMTATLYADHPELLRWNQSFAEREQTQIRRLLALLEGSGASPTERRVGVATASVKKLRTLRGAALERAYLPLMASQLDQSARIARLAAQKSSRPALRSFAQEILTSEGQDAALLRGWLRKWY